MVNVYKSIRNESGDMIKGRTKLFILNTDENGNIIDFLHGSILVPETSGSLFIIDDYVIDQVDKLKVQNGQLMVKEGEEIEEPVKSDLELQEEELLKQLEEIQKQKTADQ